VYRKIAAYKIQVLPEKEEMLPLSVIICARNEEENLKQFLPSILLQRYPEFEVIVVNDCSVDDSEWLLKKYAEQYTNLQVINLKEHPRYKHGKKFAVTIGIKAAKHEHLVFTDADCQPQSDNWLTYIGHTFTTGVEIVLGYSPYIKQPGFLNRFIRFEAFHTAMSYLSYALKNRAYMGVGRNMAYTKKLFFKGKGFANHMHIASGDDDLFVNQNASADNTAICIHPDAHVWSIPKQRYADYYIQKLRHYSASKAYKADHKRMLANQIVSAVAFYCLLLACFLIYPLYWKYFLAVYLLRLIVQLIIYRAAMKKLRVLDLFVFLPILDIVYYFYSCFSGFLSLFKGNVGWK